ncbi:ribonuclease HII [Roseibium sp. TrichSKD4]|uniref:ribonuclease HII n=1 Tax=Roseibium sp. TrichSKD4 TaxID=744980 RepID=UPI0001E5618C|nr:ribonuclease HII [Roseibium sp. TrichSKD4]EFO34422.1 ribonuclease HII [Roseibium sp. TrichSKD4]
MSKTPSLFDLVFPEKEADPALERQHASHFGGLLAGVDEAGRGPWAGPVVTAAVILDYDKVPSGLTDSKKLSEAKREELFPQICEHAFVSVASAGPKTIDLENIRTATLNAMVRAVSGLAFPPRYVMIDGRDVPFGLSAPGQALVKGDSRCLAVAAASIVAKVMRDRMMVRLDQIAPEYGFAQHKGYGVPAHQAALSEHGPSIHHRFSFKPVQLSAK